MVHNAGLLSSNMKVCVSDIMNEYITGIFPTHSHSDKLIGTVGYYWMKCICYFVETEFVIIIYVLYVYGFCFQSVYCVCDWTGENISHSLCVTNVLCR